MYTCPCFRSSASESAEVVQGPTIVQLSGATRNATHASVPFRCIDCLGNSIWNPDLTDTNGLISLILSDFAPIPSNDINAFIPSEPDKEHFGTFNFAAARFADYFSRIDEQS